MTIEIRELVIEARIGDASSVTQPNGSVSQQLTLAQEERLISQIAHRVLAQLHEELRENWEDRRC